MEMLFPVCAGIDVHRDTVVVTVRKRLERGRDAVETRTFETYEDSLVEMVAWLDEHEVPIVGLESTGVYWKPVVRMLQRPSPQRTIWLVNPVQVKQVPGRKTDVNDSQWLSKLVMYGLVSPSFLPALELEELRRLSRHRMKLTHELAACKNRIVKELESAGIKLATVCSDPLGKSARAMIEALLDGTMAPAEIADLARGVLRRKRQLLERAVSGSFSDTARFVLRQRFRRLAQVEQDIADVDAQIAQRMKPFQRESELLLAVPGLHQVSIAGIIAETGVDMSVFDSADKLTAWSGLSPGSNESAGKSKRTAARKGNKYLRTILVQAAQSAVKTCGTFWQHKFRQIVARLGPKKAIFAIARKMLVAIYYIVRDDTPYREPEAPLLSPERRQRQVHMYTGRLAALGFQVVLTPVLAAAAPPTEAPSPAASTFS